MTWPGHRPIIFFLSILFDDCLERGKGIFSGGVRYLGGTIESYGNTNAADSLAAIKKLVYDEKKLSLDQLLKILDHDFAGFEKEHRWMLNCPKFGNDDDYADNMRVEIDKHINRFARSMGPKAGLHSYLNVIINNSANTTMGLLTAASPDGRKAFTPMANANAASGGADRNGLTAYLNSIVKPEYYHPCWCRPES
jgi:pyruvate-formate lyase